MVAAISTSFWPLNGGVPDGFRVSSARQGGRVKSDRPPVVMGAKYPFTSMTRCELLVTKTSMLPFVPAGTMAALATIVPVVAFSVETRGCVCPVGQVVRYPNAPCGTAVMFSE